ncbi:hypothetical protein Shyd_71470 [Streptomyces hydrogenans]|uniref:Transposase n=1 Tax=Streptomyces hydrogenans TaxID=1873719 RepID=A0ABQ3PL68_9ACTN|nr:hypothetical protein Shyd_71470 [Streptomyces hydrogenans]
MHTLAKEVSALNEQIAEVDKLIEARFRDHRHFEVITSMPGLGIILGASSWPPPAATCPSLGTPDRLAGFGGVAPVPRDSGKISGTCDARTLQPTAPTRPLHLSAVQHPTERRVTPVLRSQTRRRQASHPSRPCRSARRRVNVLWALLRDGRCYEITPPTALAA